MPETEGLRRAPLPLEGQQTQQLEGVHHWETTGDCRQHFVLLQLPQQMNTAKHNQNILVNQEYVTEKLQNLKACSTENDEHQYITLV